jgi:hypothetical protein
LSSGACLGRVSWALVLGLFEILAWKAHSCPRQFHV